MPSCTRWCWACWEGKWATGRVVGCLGVPTQGLSGATGPSQPGSLGRTDMSEASGLAQPFTHCPLPCGDQRTWSCRPCSAEGRLKRACRDRCPERGPESYSPAARLPPDLSTRSIEGASSPGRESHPIWWAGRGDSGLGVRETPAHPIPPQSRSARACPCPRKGTNRSSTRALPWPVVDAKGTWVRGHPWK